MANKYIVYGHKYCYSSQTKQIPNEISSKNISSVNITLNFNQSNPPLFNISLLPSKSISLSSYIYNGNISCISYIKRIGSQISLKSILISQKYLMSMKFMYFTFLPIFSITLVSIFLQLFTRLSLKKTMQISLFNSSIITIGIIIIGIMYDIDSSEFQNSIKFIAINCIISPGESMRNQLLIDLTNGINTGFTILMGIVGILELLLMIALGVLWVIEIKMIKLRKQDHQSSNYQLQTL